MNLAQRTPANSPFAILYAPRVKADSYPVRKPVAKPKTAQQRVMASLDPKPKFAMDQRGRKVIDMAPRTQGAISISKTSRKDVDRNDSIKRGGI